jgi:HEAT repeat protein
MMIRYKKRNIILAACILFVICLFITCYPAARIRSVIESVKLGKISMENGVKMLGDPEKTSRRLYSYLQYPDFISPHKSSAVYMLQFCGDRGISALSDSLKHSDPDIRRKVAWTLGQFGLKSNALHALKLALADSNESVSTLAAAGFAEAAQKGGPDVQTAIDLLAESISDTSTNFPQIAEAIGNLGPVAQELVFPLITMLSSSRDLDKKRAAAKALGKIGKPAEVAVPALIEALNTNDEVLIINVAEALRAIRLHPYRSVPALGKLINDPRLKVREGVIDALSGFGPEALLALPELTMALDDSEPRIRARVAQLFGAIGEDAADAVPDLIKALDDNDFNTRLSAIKSLGQIGPDSMEAIKSLEIFTQDPDSNIREAAATAIKQIKRSRPKPENQ